MSKSPATCRRSGDMLACFALTEPQAGSDASQLLTTAERRGARPKGIMAKRRMS